MPPFLQALVGDMLSMIAMIAILAGIIKLFQMATTMSEIKDLLSEIKRNTQDYPATGTGGRNRVGGSQYHPVDTASEAEAIIRASMIEPER